MNNFPKALPITGVDAERAADYLSVLERAGRCAVSGTAHWRGEFLSGKACDHEVLICNPSP